MGAELNAEVKVPDIWFDVYARLLPGAAFVALTRYCVSTTPTIPDTSDILFMLLAGYFSGLLTQPISSRLTGWVHEVIARAHKADALYVREVEKTIDEKQASILSKMHGETKFFVQCSVLAVILLTVRSWCPSVHVTATSLVVNVILPVVLFVEAFEVSDRRFRRAQDRQKLEERANKPDAANPATVLSGQPTSVAQGC